MKGNIYTREKCADCGGPLRYNPNISAFICDKHIDRRVKPANLFVKFGKNVVYKRFSDIDAAERFLTGIRYEVDKGTFDARDYQADNPLGFANQARKWLATKAGVSSSHYANLDRFINAAVDAWSNASVKTIGYPQVEDLLLSLAVSDKTRAEYLSCYRQFFKWLQKREKIPVPDLPEVDFVLGTRRIIDIATQQAIVDEVKRICPNPRVWIGIKWLTVYIAIRPGEMRSLKESQINVNGMFTLPPTSTKEKKLKIVPMLPEDIELYNSLPRGLPDMFFFRRHKGRGVKDPGGQIGKRAFYRWWSKACDNLGIEGVDLYGGTRHSSASAMTEFFSRDEIRDHATRHGSNKAFDRYCQGEVPVSVSIYDKILQNAKEKAGKVIKLGSKGVAEGLPVGRK